MARLEFEHVGITALAAAVPQHVINNYEYTDYFPKEEVKEVVDKIGVLNAVSLIKTHAHLICVSLQRKDLLQIII